MNEIIKQYQEDLVCHDLSTAYKFLCGYMTQLKVVFNQEFSSNYEVKNILNGYLDYSYFYFLDEWQKQNGLKYGIVLNHSEMQFELWLMGRTKDVQEKYWLEFKNRKLISDNKMPQYYITKVTLIENPDFRDFNNLNAKIIEQTKLSISKLSPLVQSFIVDSL